MLGTVQLGLPYGVANRTGQPTYTEARNIVACAYAGGVRGLDTAASYGDSEERLGRILHDLRLKDLLVVSKVAPLSNSLSLKDATVQIEQSVQDSLRHLRLERLPVCLLHREGNAPYLEVLLRLKKRGLVGQIGMSIATPTPANIILGLTEVLQMPANLLDHRFTRRLCDQGLLQDALFVGIKVFVRSVYLQGLLLLPEAEVPAALRQVLPVRQVLARRARDAGLSLPEMALRYALGLGAAGVLIGVETVEQMEQNLAWASLGLLPGELQRAVVQSVPDLPDKVLSPQLWQT